MTTLLQTYTQTRTEDAFRALIAQYINLVYSACLRQLRDSHLAEDATQAVFILLHQRSAKIPPDRLSGWLLTTARFTCANIRKTERRRAHREQGAAMQTLNSPISQQPSPSEPSHDEILQLLDHALAQIPAIDREAVALHYLQNQPYASVALTLGLSEDAARKRVTRALEKLRSYFTSHDVALSSAALATLLPAQAHAAALAPSLVDSLTHSIILTCHHGAAAPALAIAKGTQAMMLTHTLKTVTTVTLIAAALLAAGWWTLTRTTQAQSAASVAAVPPLVAPVTLDLSTPENALSSYAAAIKAGNHAAAVACCTPNPDPNLTPADAVLDFMLAQNRLILTSARAFKTDGQEARLFPTLDLILEKVVAYDRATHQPALITGTSATLPFLVPESLITTYPDEVQTQIRAFINRPIRFIQQDNQWKLLRATPDSSPAKIVLLDNNKQPVNDPALETKVIKEYAAIYDHIASGLAAGTYASWSDANDALNIEKEQLHKKYSLNDISIQFTPATKP